MSLDSILRSNPNKVTIPYSGKNLITFPYADTTKTENGITYTVNSDGSIKVAGTATDYSEFILLSKQDFMSSGIYTLSGYMSGSNAVLEFLHGTLDSGVASDLTQPYMTKTFNFVPSTLLTTVKIYVNPDEIIGDDNVVPATDATFYPQLEEGISATDFSLNTGDKDVWKVSYGSRNLIPYPYYNTTKTENEVTFTVNSDNSITVNGTATADTLFFLCGVANYNIYKGTYTLSGCPNGGSNTTYCQVLGSSDYMDTGNGTTRTYTQDIKQNVFIKIFSGYTANNLVFKPQLEVGNKATSYTPYYREQVWKSTSYNLLPNPTSATQTITGVTFTNNNDGTITVNGTATANSTYNLGYSIPVETNRKYILSGCPSGGGSNVFGMYYYDTVTSAYDYGDGVTFTPKGTTLQVYIRVFNGQTVDDLVFKPKLEYA